LTIIIIIEYYDKMIYASQKKINSENRLSEIQSEFSSLNAVILESKDEDYNTIMSIFYERIDNRIPFPNEAELRKNFYNFFCEYFVKIGKKRLKKRPLLWRCHYCGGHWWAMIENREKLEGTDCPYCSNNKTLFHQSVRWLYEDLCSRLKLEELNPRVNFYKVRPGSHTPFKAICVQCQTNELKGRSGNDKNLEQIIIKKRYLCEDCSKLPRITEEPTMEMVVKNWVYDNKDADRRFNEGSPKDYTCGDSKTPIYIYCPSCNTKYRIILNKFYKGQSIVCPDCSKRASQSQIRVFAEFRTLYKCDNDEVRDQAVLFNDLSTGYEIDIYFPRIKVGLEIDGYFHKNRHDFDIKKEQDLEENKQIKIFRVRDKRIVEDCPEIFGEYANRKDWINIDFSALYKKDDGYLEFAKIYDWLKALLENRIDFPFKSRQIGDWVAKDTYKLIMEYSTPQFENSLKFKYPSVAEDLDSENFPDIDPEKIPYATNQSYPFVCRKRRFHTPYFMPVDNRTVDGCDCHYCAGVKVKEEESISSLFPILSIQYQDAIEWAENHPDVPISEDILSINTIDLLKVGYGSAKEIYWKCRDTNHPPFKSPISRRVGNYFHAQSYYHNITYRDIGCDACYHSTALLDTEKYDFEPIDWANLFAELSEWVPTEHRDEFYDSDIITSFDFICPDCGNQITNPILRQGMKLYCNTPNCNPMPPSSWYENCDWLDQYYSEKNNVSYTELNTRDSCFIDCSVPGCKNSQEFPVSRLSRETESPKCKIHQDNSWEKPRWFEDPKNKSLIDAKLDVNKTVEFLNTPIQLLRNRMGEIGYNKDFVNKLEKLQQKHKEVYYTNVNSHGYAFWKCPEPNCTNIIDHPIRIDKYLTGVAANCGLH
jgi:hypothetical protein